jgi:hypothetical protein
MGMLLNVFVEGRKMDANHHMFEQFIIIYQPVLQNAEDYLEDIIEKTAPAYAEAYKPWKNAIHELIKGTFLISRKIPLPDKQVFMEALQMFSFDSAIQFLRDICKLCSIKLNMSWEKEFREHINQLLFAMANLNRQQHFSFSR